MSHVLPAPVVPRAALADRGATLADLSPREVEVVRLITHGCSNEEIAQALFVTGNTVKSFIRSAYRKLGVTRRAQAVIWGFQQGLLDAGVTGAAGEHPDVA